MRHDTAVREAEREATDAQHELDAMTERVREGDDSITPKRLAAQQQVVDFARLRVDAAHRTATRLREEERKQLADHAREAAAHLIANDGSAEIVTAVVAACEAVAVLRQAIEARNAKIAAVAANISRVATSVMEEKGDMPPYKATQPYGISGDFRAVSVHGTGTAEAYSAGRLGVAALMVGLGVDSRGDQLLNEARDVLSGQTNLAIQSIGAKVPGLADAWRLTPEQWADASQLGRYRANEQGRRPLPEQG